MNANPDPDPQNWFRRVLQRLCHTVIQYCSEELQPRFLCSGVSRSSAAAAAKYWGSGVTPATSGGSGVAPTAAIGDHWRDLLQLGVQG
jgi:hypothetical protein